MAKVSGVLAAIGIATTGLTGVAQAAPSSVNGVGALAAGTFVSIVEDRTGKCVDIPFGSTDAFVQAIEWTCHGGNNQKFTTINLGTGFFLVENQNSGLCLEAVSSFTPAAVVQDRCDSGNTGQRWRLMPVPGDPAHLWLNNGFTSNCATIAGNSAQDGTKIEASLCVDQDRMFWHFA